MTIEELDKKFSFVGKDGICSTCAYVTICDKILPGYNKNKMCKGPFYAKVSY